MDAVGVLRKTLVANLLVTEYVLDHTEDMLYPNSGPGKHPVPFLPLRELPVPVDLLFRYPRPCSLLLIVCLIHVG